MSMYKRIFLTGFRTTGKSTVGKLLAEKLNWSFFDMDFLISQEAARDIGELTKNGTDWKEFRKIENEVLNDLCQMEQAVISCGGGVGVNDIIDIQTNRTYGKINSEILNKSEESLIILLKADEKLIEARLRKLYRNKKIMPVLNENNAKQLEKLYDEEEIIEEQVRDSMKTYKLRKPVYESLTAYKIDVDSLNPVEISDRIIQIISQDYE